MSKEKITVEKIGGSLVLKNMDIFQFLEILIAG